MRKRDLTPMQVVDQTFEGDEERKLSPRHRVMVPLISFVFKQCLEVESMSPQCTVDTQREIISKWKRHAIREGEKKEEEICLLSSFVSAIDLAIR